MKASRSFVVVAFAPLAALAVFVACGGSVDGSPETKALPPADDEADASFSDAAPSPPVQSDAAVDDGAAVGDGAAGDAETDASTFPNVPELAECAPSAYELHVTASGDCGFGPSGSFGIDGTKGTWGGRVITNTFMQLDILSGNGWAVAVNADTGLLPGTYTTATRSPRFAVKVDGESWIQEPGGTFTIFDIAKKGGDQASLTYFLASFDLRCDAGGTVRGCVRYGR